MNRLSYFTIQIQSGISKTQSKSKHHPKNEKYLSPSPNKVQENYKILVFNNKKYSIFSH